MAFDPFAGTYWTLPLVEDRIRFLQRQWAECNMMTSGGTGDLNVAKARQHSIETALEKLYAKARALGSTDYPAESTVRDDRLKLDFSRSRFVDNATLI